MTNLLGEVCEIAMSGDAYHPNMVVHRLGSM
jgi:hypothetical protein